MKEEHVAFAARTKKGKRTFGQKKFQKEKSKGGYKGKHFDISKVKCFNPQKMGHLSKDCMSKKKGDFKGKHHAPVVAEEEEPRKRTRGSFSNQERRK